MHIIHEVSLWKEDYIQIEMIMHKIEKLCEFSFV